MKKQKPAGRKKEFDGCIQRVMLTKPELDYIRRTAEDESRPITSVARQLIREAMAARKARAERIAS